ncbi:MAG: hypothetical protein Q4F05_16715 [bacterium]|nr:hypothetical protein [bacterium]
MRKKVRTKLIVFNGLFMLSMIILFSRQLVGLSVTSHQAVIQALSITIIIMGIIVFIYVNYQLLRKHEELEGVDTYNLDRLVTPQDYMVALSSYRNKKAFLYDINEVIGQIQRFTRKQNALITLLYQNFNNDDNLTSLSEIVNKTERMLYSNIKLILNRLSIFDELEYESMIAKKTQTAQEDKKYRLTMEHITYVKELRERNEELLLEFDRLLTEISRMIASEEANDLSNIKDFIDSMEKLHSDKDQEMEELESKYKEDK